MEEMTAETTSTIESTEAVTSSEVTGTQDTVGETTTSQESEPKDTTDGGNQTDGGAIDYEKQYKELQSAYTKGQQELAELRKRVPEQPQIVDEKGKVTTEFEKQFNFRVDDFEFTQYQTLATRLDSDVMPEAMEKLNKAKQVYAMGDMNSYKSLMNEVKEYFNPSYVEEIATQKAKYEAQKQEYIDNAIKEQKYQSGAKLENDLKQNPEIWELVNPDSENYSEDVFGVVAEYFNNFGGIDVGRLDKFLKSVEANGVRKYKANLEAQKTAEMNKQKSTISGGDGGEVTASNVEFGSPEYWEKVL